MLSNPFLQTLFYVFTTAFAGATVALLTRQSLLVVYMLIGLAIGPMGLDWVHHPKTLEQFADFGILSLLFLMGMHLEPHNLLRMIKKASMVTFLSSLLFVLGGIAVSFALGFDSTEALIIGLSCSISSTILSLKLLPTTALHHQHIGAVVISVTLLQDIVAIFLLLILESVGHDDSTLNQLMHVLIGLPLLSACSYYFAKTVLCQLLRRFDRIQEYVFLMALAWCLGIAGIAEQCSLSPTIGAFIAGVSLTATPVANYIAEALKPLRDFFLILFFISLGARMDLQQAANALLPATILAIAMLCLKPAVLKRLLLKTHQDKKLSSEVATRLGQMSEFSLLISYLSLSALLISPQGAYVIQIATLITFIVSSYSVVRKYPTPVSANPRLRRD